MNAATLGEFGAREPGLFAGGLQAGGVKGVNHEAQDSCTYAACLEHMCSIEAANVQCYRCPVKPEQRIIAKWMERVRAQRSWTWNAWATAIEKAGLGKIAATTISRAVKEEYQSVTSVETLHVLARAAEVPSVLDFLNGHAFSAAALKPVLAELMPLGPKGRWTEQDVEHLAQALEYGLGLPPSDPTTPTSPDAYGTAARAAAVRFRELGEQA